MRLSITDLRALLQKYGVVGERADELVALARHARERAWWTGYRRLLTQSYLELIGYEAAAERLCQFELLIVPGLLQTAEYARAYISALAGPGARGDVEALVEVRLRRQDVLDRASSAFVFVLDEAAVRRPIGGPGVMRTQLVKLAEAADRPNVTVEVLPFGTGAHFGLLGSFTIIEFPGAADDDVLHLESTRSSVFTRGLGDDIVRHREAFADLRAASLGDGSRALLTRLAREL